jgi:hypothetical protein
MRAAPGPALAWRSHVLRVALLVPAAALAAALICVPTPEARAAAGDKDKSPSTSASGTVASITADTLVLRTDRGSLTFTLDSKTERPDDVKAGDAVEVWYHQASGAEEKIATRIVKSSPPSGPSSGSSGS